MNTIVLVDDDAGICRVVDKMAKKLFSADCIFLFCQNSLDLLKIINTNKIDYLIMDFELVNETGFEIAQKLSEENINIPIYIVSGSILDPAALINRFNIKEVIAKNGTLTPYKNLFTKLSSN